MLDEVEFIKGKPDFVSYLLKTKKENRLEDYYITKLKNLRDNFSEELPDVKVSLLQQELDDYGRFKEKYKCQKNYLIGLSLDLRSAIDDEIITDIQIIEKINEFGNYDFKCEDGEFTTQKEIDMINEVLNETIEYLEEKYQK